MHGDGNGAIYPDSPGPDRDIVGTLFHVHSNSVKAGAMKRRLDKWVFHVFDVYLAMDTPFLRENAHALQFLHKCLPAVVAKVAREYAEDPSRDEDVPEAAGEQS